MLGTLIKETLIIGSVFAVVTVVFFLVMGNLLLIGAPLRLLLLLLLLLSLSSSRSLSESLLVLLLDQLSFL